MIIYKDVMTGVDLFTDSYKLNFEEDFLINVDSVMKKFVVGGEQFNTGANASAEGEDCDEGGDETETVHQLEFAHLNRLQPVDETVIGSKSQLKDYLKKYVKKVAAKISETKGEDECKKFMAHVSSNLKHYLGKFNSNSELFSGPDFFYDDFECGLFILNRSDDGLSGTFTCVKAFLEEEKC